MEGFNLFLLVMSVVAIGVFVALYFVKAGYGIFRNRNWGYLVSNKLAWCIMESPVFFAMIFFWVMAPESHRNLTTFLFLLLFELHYFQRSFIFPFLIKGNGKMPIGVMFMGMVFNLLNSWMQGGWIFYYAPDGLYGPEWLRSPQFIIGLLLFVSGMIINIDSDRRIRSLRKAGDTGYYIPTGGMFEYVSSANYFGELMEWIGFAVLTWSWSGAVFALWTFANLAPRANSIYAKYTELFGEEFLQRKVKRIIPFIY